MNTLIKQTIEKEKQTTYSFKKRCSGIAGICPDCKDTVTWNSYHSRFECLSYDCCFMANEKGECIWDNAMCEENLKKMMEKTSLSF